MAGELKKKVLTRTQTATTEPEVVRDAAIETGQGGAPGETGKTGGPTAGSCQNPEGKSHGEPDRREDESRNAGDPHSADSQRKRAFIPKVGIFWVPALILVLGAGLILFKSDSLFHGGASENKLEPVTNIKRPVPIPDYREILDFIILNETERNKTMVALRMEFAFHSPATYQNFKDQNVLFRDTVYSFLLRQNALKNTHGSWHTVVEKDLYEYLRVKLPQSKADQIRLTQVENL